MTDITGNVTMTSISAKKNVTGSGHGILHDVEATLGF